MKTKTKFFLIFLLFTCVVQNSSAQSLFEIEYEYVEKDGIYINSTRLGDNDSKDNYQSVVVLTKKDIERIENDPSNVFWFDNRAACQKDMVGWFYFTTKYEPQKGIIYENGNLKAVVINDSSRLQKRFALFSLLLLLSLIAIICSTVLLKFAKNITSNFIFTQSYLVFFSIFFSTISLCLWEDNMSTTMIGYIFLTIVDVIWAILITVILLETPGKYKYSSHLVFNKDVRSGFIRFTVLHYILIIVLIYNIYY